MPLINLVCLLLVISTLQYVQGTMDWKVHKKINAYGQTLTLYCRLGKACEETAGWVKWISNTDFETLVLSVRETSYAENFKYDGRLGKLGFYLMIGNVSKADFDANYSCTYSVETSPKKLLTVLEAFESVQKEITPEENEIYSDDSSTKVTTALIIVSVLLFTTVVVLALVLFWSLRVRRNSDTTTRHDTGNTRTAGSEETGLLLEEKTNGNVILGDIEEDLGLPRASSEHRTNQTLEMTGHNNERTNEQPNSSPRPTSMSDQNHMTPPVLLPTQTVKDDTEEPPHTSTKSCVNSHSLSSQPNVAMTINLGDKLASEVKTGETKCIENTEDSNINEFYNSNYASIIPDQSLTSMASEQFSSNKSIGTTEESFRSPRVVNSDVGSQRKS